MKHTILLFILLLFIGCAKENIKPSDYTPEAEEGMVIEKNDATPSNNMVYDAKQIHYLVYVTDTEVVYDSKVPRGEEMVIGKVLNSDESVDAPYGFLRYILDRKEENGNIILTTRDATIDEAFDYIDIKSLYRTIGKSIYRGPFELETQAVGEFGLDFGAGYKLEITPEFGMSGDLIFDLKFDKNNPTELRLTAGVRDGVFKLITNSKINGIFSAEKASDEFPVNLPFVIVIQLPDLPPLRITSRIVFVVEGKAESKGGFELQNSVENKPITMIMDFYPDFYSGPTFSETEYTNPNGSLSDLNFTNTLLNAFGNVDVGVGLPFYLEMSPYGKYDQGKIYAKLDLFNINLENKTQTTDGKLQIASTLVYKPSLAIGAEVTLLEKLFSNKYIPDGLKIQPVIEFKLWETEFPYGTNIYEFPCDVTFNNGSRMEVTGDINTGSLNIQCRINSPNGSPDGFHLSINDIDIGAYPYKQINTISLNGNDHDFILNIKARDASNGACFLLWDFTNPSKDYNICTRNYIDARDGTEYCTKVMADGKEWMLNNMNYSGNGGICVDNDIDKCTELGRYYNFEEVSDVCPAGFRIPTIDEFETLFRSESLNSFIWPKIPDFFNVDPASSNGFNLIANGQQHTWKVNLGVLKASFTGSVYDSGEKYAMLWTSTERPSSPIDPSLDVNRTIVKISIQGVSRVYTTETTRVGCRCIKN